MTAFILNDELGYELDGRIYFSRLPPPYGVHLVRKAERMSRGQFGSESFATLVRQIEKTQKWTRTAWIRSEGRVARDWISAIPVSDRVERRQLLQKAEAYLSTASRQEGRRSHEACIVVEFLRQLKTAGWTWEDSKRRKLLQQREHHLVGGGALLCLVAHLR